MEEGGGGDPAQLAALRASLKDQPEDLVLAFPKGDGDEALVPMHKALGMACSDFIKSRLTGKWQVKEDELDGQPVPRFDVPVGAELGQIPENGLLKLVNFWYEGTLQLSKDEDQGITDALDVFIAGDFMQVWRGVSDLCKKHLLKCASVHTWQRLCLVEEDARFDAISKEVVKGALKYAAWNFIPVTSNPSWPGARVKHVVSLFKDPYLNELEDRVLEAALVWMSRNHDASAEDVYAILEAVRLPQVSLKRMGDLKALSVVQASAECQGLLAEAAAWSESSSGGRLWGPRGHRSLIVVGEVWAQRYDVSTNTWVEVDPLVGAWRPSAAATSLGGVVYLAGGVGVGAARGNRSAQVTCFDPAADGAGAWAEVAPMGTARSSAAAAALNGLLYVAGGYDDDDGELRTVERYDPVSNTWEAVASMTSNRYLHQLVALGGFLYAIGGFGRKAGATAERYDPATNTWTPIASMACPRYRFAAAAMGGFLYVTGGLAPGSKLWSCERYDPASNTWSRIADLPVPRFSHALACLRGSLYAVGGSAGENGTTPPWRYDDATNTWVLVRLASGSAEMKGFGVENGWAAV
jgi:N-acetylneuraminic acid mutarotase